MEGNDFIMFKHGCGNDSMYEDPDSQWDIDRQAKQRFDEPCSNLIFYHVEVEYVGKKSFLYKSEDDSNPIIFKMRNATLLDWDLTSSGKEQIWFDRQPKVILKSDRNKKESTMRSVILHKLYYLTYV